MSIENKINMNGFNEEGSRFELYIKNHGTVYRPLIEGEVTVDWERENTAGKLEFTVVKDEVISYGEGNTVILTVDKTVFFYGYVFAKSRTGKQLIRTVCYDQLRYLKNKDTYQYKDKTLSELLKQICSDRNLKTGEIIDTSYKIPKMIEQNKEYFEMLKNAKDLTTAHEGKLYTIYDKQGKICLGTPEQMKTENSITYDNTIDFDYKTSIDEGVYNRIKIDITDDENSKVRTEIVEDKQNIEEWGVLQYYVSTNNADDIKDKAKKLLKLLNQKHRSLTIKDTVGDLNVRAGCLVPVIFMFIGDININGYMLVERVTHKFKEGYHFMDLEVYNKDIMPKAIGDGLIQDKQKEGNTQAGDSGQMFKGVAPNQRAKAMLDSSYSRIGYNYSRKARGKGKNEDCSYHVWKSMKDAGFPVPSRAWDTSSMAKSGCFIPIPFSEVRAGDVGIKPKTGGKNNGHTVIATSQSQVIHSTPPATKTSNMGKYANYPWYRPVDRK